MSSRPLLAIKGISKSFPGVRALDDVAVDVDAGEIHGLVGGNGAGKSTLMAIVSGALMPDMGSVTVLGETLPADPVLARDLGIAIVRQEPSLLPDLTIAENFYLTLPRAQRPTLGTGREAVAAMLAGWGGSERISPRALATELEPEQRFITDIARAIASRPRILILDEPTEHLSAANCEVLFSKIETLAKQGTAIIYISHRLPDVRRIATRITVLRDGRTQGTFDAREVSEAQIVEMVVGRALEDEFPSKASDLSAASTTLEVRDFNGRGFTDVSFHVRAGEIVGFAGIEDNGQREVLRALAGMIPAKGTVRLGSEQVRLSGVSAAWRQGFGLLSGDRAHEGTFVPLTVRENFSIRSLASDSWLGFVNGRSEARRAAVGVKTYGVKTPSIETPVSSLSGGNQQKLMVASVAAADPEVMLIDEPTQGVDVGARAEIYQTLRRAAGGGTTLLVASSDAAELAGLCDRVCVFSRGRIVVELSGSDLTENRITESILTATSTRARSEKDTGGVQFFSGHAAPIAVAAAAVLVLGIFAGFANEHYLTTRNFGGMLALVGTLALVAYGQQIVMLLGEIDLSVGPLMGLCCVVASFFLVSDFGGGDLVLGLVAMFGVALIVGLVNFLLVDAIRLHPMVATLATYMGVQAVSLILRPVPAGLFDTGFLDVVDARLGFAPITFILAAFVAIALEYTLFRRPIGLAMRGIGSRPDVARQLGLRRRRARLVAYLGCAAFAALAAIPMIAQVGIGEPRSGVLYTLLSVAAVVIGGGRLTGARGSFLGVLFGALLLNQVNTIAAFLQFNDSWNLFLQGGVILLGALLYSRSASEARAQ